MNSFYPPILEAPADLVNPFYVTCSASKALEFLERAVTDDRVRTLPLVQTESWRRLSGNAIRALREHDHLVIKGLPVTTDGASLLLASCLVGSSFRIYRNSQIVKFFKMSPWTTELSHTTRPGEFHTDLNTEPSPPAITAMQCISPDPDSPCQGNNRVARLVNLLMHLKERGNSKALQFLTEQTVAMVNDHSPSIRRGRIVEGNVIRYHPATLRAAEGRLGSFEPRLEERIAEIAEAAFAVSESFGLERGDILILSNHRTLHYRGECSVVFKNYPTEFTSRSVFVLHANQELKG